MDRQKLTLKVSEALAKDVSRGIARIDPEDMLKIDVEVEDIIQITGKRPTVAKVMPTSVEGRGKDIIQIDGITRENAQIGLGEHVHVEKVDYKAADSIVLTPVASSSASSWKRDSAYIGRLLEGIVVAQGDKVRVTLFGTRYQEFFVEETTPEGVVVVNSTTSIEMKGERITEKREIGVTYEDIGGLHKEVQRIREMIELPLKYPEVFERLGIEAPKGVLLYGPPGCGKTLIARAVANEADAYFHHVSGPEIAHKFYGESEEHLRSIFEKAKEKEPAIIFFDEIDSIAIKREEVGPEHEAERRVASQLLALMDGLKSRGKVIVIGATNIPDVLDMALRRPGRFDREILINIPDQKGRLEILQIHTRGMPLASDVDLERLAEITHGFVGADLSGLAREAAMVTFRKKIMPMIEFEGDQIPYELVLGLEVTMADFMEALGEIKPGAMRDVFSEIPEVGWSDVGGLDEVKRVLKETIEWPIRYPEIFEQANTKAATGILLTGLPGTGKTLLAKAVARECGVNFISVKGPALLSKSVGGPESGVREIFKKARQARPCILFFDELDAIALPRGLSGDSRVTERFINQLLAELDGIEKLDGVVVLAASNRPDIIDPALLRTGRFDFQLELPIPDEKMRLEIFKIHTRGKPLASDVDLDALARATEGMVGSDIEAISRRAAMLAIREFINNKQDSAQFRISARNFNQALEAVGRAKAQR
jgi:transitional endoplasmic reticulum ATPase